MKQRTPDKLKGKRVYFYRTRDGFRGGIVKRVDWSRRSGKLRAVTVLTSAGRRIKVTAHELTMPNHPTGVLWFRKLVPIAQWLG